MLYEVITIVNPGFQKIEIPCFINMPGMTRRTEKNGDFRSARKSLAGNFFKLFGQFPDLFLEVMKILVKFIHFAVGGDGKLF